MSEVNLSNNQIVDLLNNRGVNKPCPRCDRNRFQIVGRSLITINENPNVMTIGGPSIPVVLTACSNCGYISQHAIRALQNNG